MGRPLRPPFSSVREDLDMRQKRQIPWKTLLVALPAALVGAVLGYWAMGRADAMGGEGLAKAGHLLLILALAALAYLVQIMVHEGGHLVCGLLTGYRLMFYRIGRVMVARVEGRWRLCRYHIPGTGGQCLMAPPERTPVPYRLYNWGGGLANLLLSALALPLFLQAEAPPAQVFFGALVLLGIGLAVTSLVPMQAGGVGNDGYNAQNLGKNAAALEQYVCQLRINAALMEGRSPSDMPEEWFPLPPADSWGNPFAAASAMQAAGRRLEQGAVEEAEGIFRALLDREDLLGLYRLEITCEVIFCGLLLGRPRAELEALNTPELEKYRRATRPYFLSRSRQDYAWALLAERDRAAAEKARARFEAAAARSPYPGELAGERRLLELVDRAAGDRHFS